MEFKQKSYLQSILQKGLIKYSPIQADFDKFFNSYKNFIEKVNLSVQNNQTEENLKGHLEKFLLESFYKDTNIIETKSYKGQIQADLAIFQTTKNNSPIEVLIEVKKPSNKAEMISLNDLNKKALHEAVFYYLFEKIECKNNELKHLIITNLEEVYIFDARDIEKAFYNEGKSQLAKEFVKWKSKILDNTNTSLFYEIIKEYINSCDFVLDFTCINLKSLTPNPLKEGYKTEKLLEAYKLLCPFNLLKKSPSNDSNSLNRRFYEELLYIMGLEEKEENGKTLIKIKGKNNTGSIIETLISKIENQNKLQNIKNIEEWGSSSKEQKEEIAFELCITWINRLLFLKLLEAQLVKWHLPSTNFTFLNTNKIKSWEDLSFLFFEVLAIKEKDRVENLIGFELLPYLNSSLFEMTSLERQIGSIDYLSQAAQIQIFNKTILENKENYTKLNTLEYLLKFLSGYNFGVEKVGSLLRNTKEIINAAVLGLIFEKINGYKDGAVFTPSFITMYMCRESTRKIVIEKFNQQYNFNCQSIEELSKELYRNKISEKEANQIINSIKICDPSVGSGHFLVSALNEIISIKSDLDILIDEEGKSLGKYYKAYIENDELLILDLETNKTFEYKVENYKNNIRNVSSEKTRIQKTIFHEKQKIIENCLFGVDINPNSVQICQLRLWIELLKNAYYISETTYSELQTLPNIDINIKCGNSLISKFDLYEKYNINSEKGKIIDEYKNIVINYKKSLSPKDKNEIRNRIKNIKNTFVEEFNANSPLIKKLKLKQSELVIKERQIIKEETKTELLGKDFEEEANKNIKTLESNIQIINKEIEETKIEIEKEKKQEIYRKAFEWRFEFPEVLDENGNFTGFDLIIGNPPYVRRTELLDSAKIYYQNKYKSAYKQYDLYILFIEKGFNLLKEKGSLCLINPKFFVNEYGFALRKLILENYSINLIVDIGQFNVFDRKSTYPCISFYSKEFDESNEIQFFGESQIEINKTLQKISLTKPRIYSQKELLKDTKDFKWIFNGSALIDSILEKIENTNYKVCDLYICHRGLANDKVDFRSNGKYQGIKSPQVKKYEIKKSSLPLNFINKELENKFTKVFSNELIILPRTVLSLIATLKDDSQIILDRIYYLQQKDNQKTSNKFILALLNSKLINFWFEINYKSTKINGGYFDLRGVQIESIPLKIPTEKQEKPIVQLVEKVTSLKEENKNAMELEDEIDILVYDLYGLTQEERKIIKERS